MRLSKQPLVVIVCGLILAPVPTPLEAAEEAVCCADADGGDQLVSSWRSGAGLLPPEIPARVEPTLLTPLLRRGFFEREREMVQRILHGADAVWPRFVDRGWVEEILRVGPQRSLDNVLLWHCVGSESWVGRHGWTAASRHRNDTTVSLTESAA